METSQKTHYESRTKILGHPIHPMLIVFPIALIALGLLTDVVHLLADTERWADFAVWSYGLGIVTGAAAAAAGWNDWFGLPPGSRARKVGLSHAIANTIALALATISVLLRITNDNDVNALAFITGLLSFGVLNVGGWLGGELVYKLGVAVEHEGLVEANSAETLTVGDRPPIERRRVVKG